MDSNLLALNQQKTKIFVIARDHNARTKVVIPANPDPVVHSNTINVLGILVSEDLKWNQTIQLSSKSLINQLNARISAIRKVVIYSDKAFSIKLANGLFMSRLIYGIQVWGMAPKYLINKLQVCQNNAARATLGHRSLRMTRSNLLKEMNWLSVENLVILHMAKLIHQVINTGKPEYISLRLNGHRDANNKTGTRSSTDGKLGPRPRAIGKSTYTKHTFISRAFEVYNGIPNILTAIVGKTLFSTRLKMYLRCHDDLPDIHNKDFQSRLPQETVQRLLAEDALSSHTRVKRTKNGGILRTVES
jgi:hypothetical protein